MIFIDTHTHLYDEQLITEEQEMIERAIDAGVTRMYMPNCDSGTIAGMMHIAQTYPQHCFPMMGLHPCYVKEHYRDELAIVEKHLAENKFPFVVRINRF